MKSQIIITVEHGEDTDEFTDLTEYLASQVERYSWCSLIDYDVRVDV